jgi:hypothetical protein
MGKPLTLGQNIPADTMADLLAQLTGIFNVAHYTATGLTVAAAITQAIADANQQPGGLVLIPGSVPAGGSITGLGATTSVMDCRGGVNTLIPGITISTDGASGLANGLVLSNQTNQAGAATGTLTNAPAATNPNFWLPVNINGVLRKIPCW